MKYRIKRGWVTPVFARRSPFAVRANVLAFVSLACTTVVFVALLSEREPRNLFNSEISEDKVVFVTTNESTRKINSSPFNNKLKDNIHSVFKEDSIRHDVKKANAVQNGVAKHVLNAQNNVQGREGKNGNRVLVKNVEDKVEISDHDEPTSSEEDFDNVEEFHPPGLNLLDVYKTIGSLVKFFVGDTRNDLPVKHEAVGSSQRPESDEISFPVSKVFSVAKTRMKMESETQGEDLKDNKELNQHLYTKNEVHRINKRNNVVTSPETKPVVPSELLNRDAIKQKNIKVSPPFSVTSSTSHSFLNESIQTWPSVSTTSTPSWIQEALEDPKRKENAVHIQEIYELLLSWNKKKEESRCSNIATIGRNTDKKKQPGFEFDPNRAQSVCLDPDFQESFGKGCLVYSFGVTGGWDFENKMAEKGCKVWVFDASLDQKPSTVHPTIRFNNVGLGPKNQVRLVNNKEVQFHTLETILGKLGHNKTIVSYLKINLEGQEWPVLDQIMIESPVIANNFLQMGLATHLHAAMTDPELYKLYSNVLTRLESLGFELFSSKEVVGEERDVYCEPALKMRSVSLTNYLAYIRI